MSDGTVSNAWHSLWAAVQSPKVVCLCGSTRFGEAFAAANLSETLQARIVLSVGCTTHSDAELQVQPETKRVLDELHLRKIDLADDVLVLNVEGYIGESTMRELAYAIYTSKPTWFLEPEAGEQFMRDNSHALALLVAGFVRST